MPVAYSEEFRRDVVAVARQGGRSRAEVARSFGISESCLSRWLRVADREDDVARTAASADRATAPAAGGVILRTGSCASGPSSWEQENEILRRATAYFARDVLPQ